LIVTAALRKAELAAELVRVLRDALAVAEAAHATAIEGMTHSEAKSESDKDTRAIEQSYVARGQAMRVEELRAGLADVEKMASAPAAMIASGALVTVQDEDGAEHRYLVAPSGGGTALAGGRVQVVTPRSPLGRALCGKRSGDDVDVNIAGKKRAFTITHVA
jgi:transcription elongation GreA/GreB family factor